MGMLVAASSRAMRAPVLVPSLAPATNTEPINMLAVAGMYNPGRQPFHTFANGAQAEPDFLSPNADPRDTLAAIENTIHLNTQPALKWQYKQNNPNMDEQLVMLQSDMIAPILIAPTSTNSAVWVTRRNGASANAASALVGGGQSGRGMYTGGQ